MRNPADVTAQDIPLDTAFVVTGYCIGKNGFFRTKDENATKNDILKSINNGIVINEDINNLDPAVKDKYVKFGFQCFEYFKNSTSATDFMFTCKDLADVTLSKKTISKYSVGILAAMFSIYNNALLNAKQSRDNSDFKEEIFKKFRLGSDHNCTIPDNFKTEEKQGKYGNYYEVSFEQDGITYKFNTTEAKIDKVIPGKTIFVKIFNHKVTNNGMPILILKVLKY